jgi:NDP-sugar pyrophosphorylase family protein
MFDTASLQAVILAGGLGLRLRSVLPDAPKALADTAGIPVMGRLLDQITAAGIQRATVCTGHRATQLEEVFGGGWRNLELGYSRESEPLGTAGALINALPALTSNELLVLNGDSFCEYDLPAFYEWHRERAGDASILLTQVPEPSRFGLVSVDDSSGRVTRFIEKGADVLGTAWINAGVYVLRRSVLEDQRHSGMRSLERELFPSLIGHGLFGYQGGGRFIDIGTPESLAEARTFFARHG